MAEGDGTPNMLEDWMEGWSEEDGAPTPGSNPAAPLGADDLLGQWARDNGFQPNAAGQLGRNPQGDPLREWADSNGFVAKSKSWYTGANAEGERNGWDSQFYSDFFDQQKEAQEKGELGSFFARPGATGVVTWDHEIGGTKYEFGDIYKGGTKVANVYEDFGKDGGNAMMSQLMFDETEARKLFEEDAAARQRRDPDAGQHLERAVTERREYLSRVIPQGQAARAMEEKIAGRAESIGEGGSGLALIGGGVAGGGALGGGLGLAGGIFAPITVPAGIIGGSVIGGVAAWFNQDELANAAARAYEITALSSEKNNSIATAGTFLQQWSAVGGRFLSPISNLVQGGYDAAQGDVGDSISEFRAVDPETGERKAGKRIRALDIGASFLDAGLQFSSSVGVLAFKTQMSGQIAGGTGEMLFSGGKTFDDRRGGFDNVFTDDNGNFDPVSAAAGIGNVAIDVLQLGMASGLARQVNIGRAAVGGPTAYAATLPGKFGDRAAMFLPKWAGGWTDKGKAREALKAVVGKTDEVGGMRYALNESGEAVSRRGTLAILAPSEQVAALDSARIARRALAERGGAVSTNNFYKAAQQMSLGQSPIKKVLINALGEGYEEATQAILEPISHDGRWDAGQIGEAFLYGSAMGAGMGTSFMGNSLTPKQKLQEKAKLGHFLMTGGEILSDAEVKKMSQQELQGLAGLGIGGDAVTGAAFKKVREDLGKTLAASTPELAWLRDAISSEYTRQLKSLTADTDRGFVMTHHEATPKVDTDGNLLPGSIPSDAIATSDMQMLVNLNHLHKGFAVHQTQLMRELEALDENAPPEERARLERLITVAERSLAAGKVLMDSLAPEVQKLFELRQTGRLDRSVVEPTTILMNEKLRRAFVGLDPRTGAELSPEDSDAMQRASTLIWARYPLLGAGSFQALAPFVSAAYTAEGAHYGVSVSPAILKAIDGDFDGDLLSHLAQIILDDNEFLNLRTGRNMVGVGTTRYINPPSYEKYIIEFLSDALNDTNLKSLNSVAHGAMMKIQRGLNMRFRGRVQQTILDRAFEEFEAAIKAGDPNSRLVLMTALDQLAPEELSPVNAPKARTNDTIFIDELMRAVLNEFQSAYAASRPVYDLDLAATDGSPSLIRLTPEVATQRAEKAATEGFSMSVWKAGVTLFRKFQKVHYTHHNSRVSAAERIAMDTELNTLQQIELYEESGQGIVQSELDRVQYYDAVLGRVFVQLERAAMDLMAEEGMSMSSAIVLVANMAVQDIYYVDGEPVVGKDPVSLLQMLLRTSIRIEMRDKAAVIAKDPALQAKYAALEGLTRAGGHDNAERAFLKVFGSRQLYFLMGDAAELLGPHLTLEQFARKYTRMSETERSILTNELLHKIPEYLSAGGHHKLPYNLVELTDKKKKISAFRSVIDSVVSVGNNTITMNEDGELKGRMADNADTFRSELKLTLENIQTALREYMDLKPSTKPILEQVQGIVHTFPDFAPKLLALLPKSLAPVVMPMQPDGKRDRIASWFYETLTITNLEEAEYHLYRNLLMSKWVSTGLQSAALEDSLRTTPTELEARRFMDIDDRMLRVFYMQIMAGPVAWSSFLDKLYSFKSVDALHEYVNKSPEIRLPGEAPLVPWFNDTADFDEDKAGGGWSSNFAGSLQRKAITELQASAVNFLRTVKEERDALRIDKTLLRALTRVREEAEGKLDENGRPVQALPGDKPFVQGLQRALDQGATRMQGLGPRAFMDQVLGALRGFQGQSHTKAINPSNVVAPGVFENTRDGFGNLMNVERVLAALTAVDLDDVSNNLGMLQKDSVRTMDDDGRPIVWTPLTLRDIEDSYDDPAIRAFVRGVAFPTVMEVDSNLNLRPQLLVGKSLADLASGKAYNDLFKKEGDRYTLEADILYLVAVEAETRRFGGVFPVQRAVNDIVLRWAGSSFQTMTEAQQIEMVVEAIQAFARFTRGAATLALSGENDETGQVTDLITPFMNAVRVAARETSRVQSLVFMQEGDSVEEAKIYTEMLRQHNMTGYIQQRDTLLEMSMTTDIVEAAQIQAQIRDLDKDIARFEERFDFLTGSLQIPMLVEARLLPEDGTITDEILAKRALVYSEVRDNPQMLELTPTIQEILKDIMVQRRDPDFPGMPDLDQKKWNELSRGLISVRIKDLTEVSASSVQLPIYPNNGDVRYLDTTSAYLAESVLDVNSPILKAAKLVHASAGRLSDTITDKELQDILEKDVFNEKRMGKWNRLVMDLSIEANNRINSAGMELGVTKPGSSAKNEDIVSASLKRTYLKPLPETISTVTISPDQVGSTNVWLETQVILAGAQAPTNMALIELNNRFASSVLVQMSEGPPVELLDRANVAIIPLINGDVDLEATNSEYRPIHLTRISSALDLLTAERQKRGEGVPVAVTIKFLHSSSQPPGDEWVNNVYYEGLNFTLDADMYSSLNAGAMFSPGGIVGAESAASFEAAKQGTVATVVIEMPSSDEVADAESGWEIDLEGVLRDKTKRLMTKNLGFGLLPEDVYNWAYKRVKLQHYAIVPDVNGEPQFLRAEQVIALQRQGQSLPEGSRLWVPTMSVLRKMLGEQGFKGPRTAPLDKLNFRSDQAKVFPATIPDYLKENPHILAGETARLQDTRVVHRARQSLLTVTGQVTDKQLENHDMIIQRFKAKAAEQYNERFKVQGAGVQFTHNRKRMISASLAMHDASNIRLDMTGVTPIFTPQSETVMEMEKLLIKILGEESVDELVGAFIHLDDATTNVPMGYLSGDILTANEDPMGPVYKDRVLIDVARFFGDVDRGRKVIDFYMNKGLTIVLGASSGSRSMIYDLGNHIEGSSVYQRDASGYNVYRPVESVRMTKNDRALASTLVEVGEISPRDTVLVYKTNDVNVEEGAGLVNPRNDRLGAAGVLSNIVVSSAMKDFNLAVRSVSGTNQVTEAIKNLNLLDSTSEGRAFVLEQATGGKEITEEERAGLETAWKRLIERINTTESLYFDVDPSLHIGDFIPLVDGRGRMVLLRHGYRVPDNVREQLKATAPGMPVDFALASFGVQREAKARAHSGSVRTYKFLEGYGLSLELEVPLQVLNDKLQLNNNGLKLLLAPMPPEIELPSGGFSDSRDVDVITDKISADKKEAWHGDLTSARNMMAFAGWDSLGDWTEFFFPGKRNDAASRQTTRGFMEKITTLPRIDIETAYEIITRRVKPSFLVDALTVFSQDTGIDPGVFSKIDSSASFTDQVTTAAIVYLMVENAKVEHILESGSLLDSKSPSDYKARLMPRLYTMLFDTADPESELRREFVLRINNSLPREAADGSRWFFDTMYNLHALNRDPSKNMVGTLLFDKATSSGDNPVLSEMAASADARQAVSPHTASTVAQSINGIIATDEDLDQAKLYNTPQIPELQSDTKDGALWSLLTALPAVDDSFTYWRPGSPLESDARISQRALMVKYRALIDTTDDDLWKEYRKEYRDLVMEILGHLNLQPSQAGLVDGWVRQMLGRPEGVLLGEEKANFVSGFAAVAAARKIRGNVEAKLMPVMHGFVPRLHFFDLNTIYQANKDGRNAWQPRLTLDENSDFAMSKEQWIDVALGSGEATKDRFHPLFLEAFNGFTFSYTGAAAKLAGLQVSTDAMQSFGMLDPENNRLLASVSGPDAERLANPVVMEAFQARRDDLRGGKRIAGRTLGKPSPADIFEIRNRQINAWYKQNPDLEKPIPQTMRDLRKNGARFAEDSVHTNALLRGLIDIRLMTTLINPPLIAMMPVDLLIRQTLENVTNIATGQSTGPTGRLLAKAGLSRLSEEQMARLGLLYTELGRGTEFKGMLYKDLFVQHSEPLKARGMQWLAKGADFAGRMQDPTYGMPATFLAKRYIEAAIDVLLAMPGSSTITVDALIEGMSRDKQFLRNGAPDIHQMALNKVADVRSLRKTSGSAILGGALDVLNDSDKGRYRLLGGMARIPLMFQTFAFNAGTTFLGLQGLDQAYAVIRAGKEKNGVVRRIQQHIKGENFDITKDSVIDMDDVIESIDLTNAFLRGGLTHVGLFSFGMMAGGLGLSGEDEETRRRRRAAEYQGAAFVYDPRRLDNDFRNKDAIFLDWMPTPLKELFGRRIGDETTPGGPRYITQMHWPMKAIFSPIIGMEKFFNTGEFKHVVWGFEDALGSMPLVNPQTYKDTTDTVADLNAMAQAEQRNGGELAHVKTTNILTQIVGLYEGLIFESSFGNALYIGRDEVVRDPYIQVRKDSDGDTQEYVGGLPRPTDKLQQVVDPITGDVITPYEQRSSRSSALASLTKNRFTMAVVASLFSGRGDSDYWRYNMAPKTVAVEKQVLTEEEQNAKLLDIMRAGTQQPMLTTAEATSIIRNYIYEQTGDFKGTSAEQLRPEAEKLVKSLEVTPEMLSLPIAERMKVLKGRVPLSELDPDGDEKLTDAGARAIYQGLVRGTANIEDPSLAGIYITPQQRTKIEREWTEELVQEGIDLGLDESTATKRMKRIMNYGDSSNPEIPSLHDIIWNKQIPFNKTDRYLQLNTTYVMGPDGLPWATGFARADLFQALGLSPVNKPVERDNNSMTVDDRMNSVDALTHRNLGLRALTRLPAIIPTDEEIAKSLDDAIQKAAAKSYTPNTPYSPGSGYSRFGGRGGYGGGGGGYASWRNMFALPESRSAYSNNIPFINTSNPILRRATIRRERVWSDKGRLNQWQ